MKECQPASLLALEKSLTLAPSPLAGLVVVVAVQSWEILRMCWLNWNGTKSSYRPDTPPFSALLSFLLSFGTPQLHSGDK